LFISNGLIEVLNV